MNAKKTKFKHCHVGLLEITPSISEKPACSRTEEEMINKTTKRGKRLEKDKKNALSMEHVEKQPDFVWEIDCTTSSNVQRARNRHRLNPIISSNDMRASQLVWRSLGKDAWGVGLLRRRDVGESVEDVGEYSLLILQ